MCIYTEEVKKKVNRDILQIIKAFFGLIETIFIINVQFPIQEFRLVDLNITMF